MDRNKRPGSFGAFLLAVHEKPAKETVELETKRAVDAGTAPRAVQATVKRLFNQKLWALTDEGIKPTAKGLRYLQKHGLIKVHERKTDNPRSN